MTGRPPVKATEARRAQALALIASGLVPSAVADQVGVDRKQVLVWCQEREFKEARQWVQEAVHAEIAGNLPGLIEDAVSSVRAGIKEDPALALKFLKETGVLATAGKALGMEVVPEKQAAGGFTININTFGAQLDGPKTVEAEVVDEDGN